MAVPTAEQLAGLLMYQRIRQTREGLELSQKRFAEAVGVSERQVKRWEGGTHAPTLSNGEKIAALADRPADLYSPSDSDDVNLREVAEAVRSMHSELLEIRRDLRSLKSASAGGDSSAPDGRHLRALGELVVKQGEALAAGIERIERRLDAQDPPASAGGGAR